MTNPNKKYHKFVLFDSPKISNLMTPGLSDTLPFSTANPKAAHLSCRLIPAREGPPRIQRFELRGCHDFGNAVDVLITFRAANDIFLRWVSTPPTAHAAHLVLYYIMSPSSFLDFLKVVWILYCKNGWVNNKINDKISLIICFVTGKNKFEFLELSSYINVWMVVYSKVWRLDFGKPESLCVFQNDVKNRFSWLKGGCFEKGKLWKNS